MTVAERVIKKFGGPQAVAEIVGRDVSRIHRWTYPKERGGTDGRIPQPCQGALLKAAREQGIDLTPADFFEPSEAA